MNDVSINNGNTERAVSEIISKVQTGIIEAGRASESVILSAVERSAGDFIDALKKEVVRETAVLNSVGELLIAVANYVQSAANAFANVDTTYNASKV